MNKKLSFCVTLCALLQVQTASAFTMYLDNGWFFGPGNAVYNDTGREGVMKFVDAQVRNITFTGPFTGYIPFFNNGADEPNVIAEKLQTEGIIDGLVSDGTLINENGDTALRLNFSDPETGESVDLMVIPEASPLGPGGGEPIGTDAKGNLTFTPSIVADPGQPSLISRFSVQFTTGMAQIPLSLKTQAGQVGGQDNAGPLESGRIVIGRMGDYDQDGFMDGHLVLGANAPLDLIVGRGNPISQRRPWTSDIPIDPKTASTITLNNILQNYPDTIFTVLSEAEILLAVDYLNDIDLGMQAVHANIRRVLLGDAYPENAKNDARKALTLITRSKRHFRYVSDRLDTLVIDKSIHSERRDQLILRSVGDRISGAFGDVGGALMLLSGS